MHKTSTSFRVAVKSEQKSDTSIEVIELHPAELDLIKAIRNNWRHGEITIIARDGRPYRLMRVTEFIELGKSGQG